MTLPRPRLFFLFLLAFAFFVCSAPLHAEDATVEKIFAAVPFNAWVKQGPVTALPWKVRIQSYGLSVHQRLRARIQVEMPGRELVKRPVGDRIALLVQVTDPAGKNYRDYSLIVMKTMPPDVKKHELGLYWNMFVLPGEYKVTVALYDDMTREHNLMQGPLRVEPPKDDPLPEAWAGLPEVEFLAPRLEGPDNIFRPDVTGRLHLPLATKRPVRLEVLADVTASDLFRGSTAFYNRYLSVALPLLKALSQISLEQGSLNVGMLDLRKRRLVFEQNDVHQLDWPRAKAVLAPENGPAMIDIAALEQHRESPAFLQDELLRRLNSDIENQRTSKSLLHVFVIIGSPMDFYSFRDLPHLPLGSEEKCVVYYLQFELLNTMYADGAIGNVRKMFKPLQVRVFKVRSAESIRHALAHILEDVGSM
ncbi:MAG: hypothetical protein WA738_07655 [Candidatus Angelobacter sp.]